MWCTELVKIFCCTKKCSHTSEKQIPTCRFQTLLCMCSMKVDPSPFCIYRRLVRSAASMAALTFSLASSETKRVPLASTDQQKNKIDISPLDRVVWDVFLLPLATRKTFEVCPSSPLYMRAPLSPADAVLGHQAASRWLCGEPGKHRPRMANISPLCQHGNIWHSQARGSLRLSACLTLSLHILLVCTQVVMAPEFLLPHRYCFIIQKLSTIPKQTNQMSHNSHNTMSWLLNEINMLGCQKFNNSALDPSLFNHIRWTEIQFRIYYGWVDHNLTETHVLYWY